MKLNIRYSLRARQEEIALIEDILNRFGEKKAKEIASKIDMVINNLSMMPNLYRASKRGNGVRKCVFSKQTSIYYRVVDDNLEIITFRPNRDDPRKLKLR